MVGGIVSSKGGVKGKIGSKHRAEIVKNKLAVPFKQAEFEIRENGISEKQTVE
jgi:RecA/RadA recombinase